MTLYSTAQYLHIVGALLLFASMTMQGVALRMARRAVTLEPVRESAAIAGLTRVVGPVSVVLILVPGLYMTATSWGWVPWIIVGLAVWVVIAALGTVAGIRLTFAGRAAAAGGDELSPEQLRRIRSPLPLATWRMSVALVLGVVLLMTIKPDTSGALLTIAVAAAAGVAASLPAWRRSRPGAAPRPATEPGQGPPAG